MLRVATLIVLLCLSACATGTVLQPARVLPRDATSVTVAVEAVNSPRAPAEEQWLPQPELMLRQGSRDDLDFGFRVWPFSVEADFKYELLRSRWFDAAINDGVAVFAEASRTWPVLIRQTSEFKPIADTIQFAAGLSIRWEKPPAPAPKGPVHPFEEAPVDGGTPP